jgi:hypothetical protein
MTPAFHGLASARTNPSAARSAIGAHARRPVAAQGSASGHGGDAAYRLHVPNGSTARGGGRPGAGGGGESGRGAASGSSPAAGDGDARVSGRVSRRGGAARQRRAPRRGGASRRGQARQGEAATTTTEE